MLETVQPAGSHTWQTAIAARREAAEFASFAQIPADLDAAACARPALLGFFLRLALEQAWLVHSGVAAALAEIAAARAAAQYVCGEHDLLGPDDLAALPAWVAPMAAEISPGAARLAAFWPAASPAEIARIHALWHLLGTAEALLETGGDIRLARDPHSALNGYGCSHRPRPWAVTFASSTASSSSERGYAAADLTRLRVTAALLRQPARAPVQAALQEVRDRLRRIYRLPAGGAVILAASGTDTELCALALTHLAHPPRPILNLLVAPEETGSGVPMAAAGLHFAADTALGHDVARATPINGFQADTDVRGIALRDTTAAPRDPAAVEAEIDAAVAAGIADRRRVILHVLDLSKTGLLAPRLECLQQLRTRHGKRFDIVVDACQSRLSPASVQAYLALDATVLITGSKFFTGPPFAGAILLPPALAARLRQGRLPAGLDAYFGQDEFPPSCPAAAGLPPVGNYGLALRWHAALAEIEALLAVPLARRAEILQGFAAIVAARLAANPALTPLPAPPVARRADDESWERCPSIFTFSLAAPDGGGRLLTPEQARAVYLWLNADLSACLPELTPAGRAIAARICHIGQPVKLPGADGTSIGVLRISAGARLISGEPSHGALAAAARIEREFADLHTVFDKIELILRHFATLQAANPAPRYRSTPHHGQAR